MTMPTSATPNLHTRLATMADAEHVFNLYCRAPRYFELLSAPLPTLPEVERELEAAAQDPKRCVELLIDKGQHEDGGENQMVGYLDYKLDYPEPGDVTVNLLLIPEALQSRGYGRRSIGLLEAGLQGRAKRILASIYGSNPRAKRFWRSLGYRFAIDARPVLEWYAKEL